MVRLSALRWCYGVWAGKLRELWDCLSELRSSVCERRLERDISCDVHLLNGLLETDGEVECVGMVLSRFGQVN
jgi:hypothetical protein